MLTESQLAWNARQRSDLAAAADWTRRALGHADDLRARASGAYDRDQLDVLWLAAERAVSSHVPTAPDLGARLAAAAASIAAGKPTPLLPYARRFEMYAPLLAPAGSPPAK